MVVISWRVWGDDIVERELLRFSARNLDITPAGVAIIDEIREDIEIQFQTEGDHASGGWAPLAESTLKAKIANNYPEKILHRTLRLLESLTQPGHEDNIAKAHPWGFEFGSDVEHGKFHQTGTRTMPRRRPLEFRESSKAKWIKMIQSYIVTGDPIGAV